MICGPEHIVAESTVQVNNFGVRLLLRSSKILLHRIEDAVGSASTGLCCSANSPQEKLICDRCPSTLLRASDIQGHRLSECINMSRMRCAHVVNDY